jgi:hypothetical protein
MTVHFEMHARRLLEAGRSATSEDISSRRELSRVIDWSRKDSRPVRRWETLRQNLLD